MFRGKSLLEIDVEALSEYVLTLMWGYDAAGRQEDIPEMLDRLRDNIDAPAWRGKIAHHKALERLWHDDRDGAARELAKAGRITAQSNDVDLLQIQLDLQGNNMGLSETLSFMDRILELTTSRADRLQYGGARAFQLIMAGDEDGGVKSLQKVVQQGREMEAERPFGIRSEIWFCRVLEGVAFVTRQQALFDEVVERLERLLTDSNLSDAGRAHVGRFIGDAHRHAGKYLAAIDAYNAALNFKSDAVLFVFEAECRLGLGDSDEALRILQTVDASSLDAPERADFAFTYFDVALARKERIALETAREFLETASMQQPYFEKLRLSYIVAVQDALRALAEKRPLPKSTGLSTFLRSLSRYLLLQPNIAGIGINLNNALDDIADRATDRSQTSPHNQSG
jgi:tetratricopeptide (TPR) repeat protein